MGLPGFPMRFRALVACKGDGRDLQHDDRASAHGGLLQQFGRILARHRGRRDREGADVETYRKRMEKHQEPTQRLKRAPKMKRNSNEHLLNTMKRFPKAQEKQSKSLGRL